MSYIRKSKTNSREVTSLTVISIAETASAGLCVLVLQIASEFISLSAAAIGWTVITVLVK